MAPTESGDGFTRVRPETMERFNRFVFALIAKCSKAGERVTQNDAVGELLRESGF